MLLNLNSIAAIPLDDSYKSRVRGRLFYAIPGGWSSKFAILKANMLFLYKSERETNNLEQLLIIEDCRVDLCDEEQSGKSFAFEIRFQTSGNSYRFAAESVQELEKWVSCIVGCTSKHVKLAKELYEEQQQKRSMSSPSGS